MIIEVSFDQSNIGVGQSKSLFSIEDKGDIKDIALSKSNDKGWIQLDDMVIYM